MSEKIFEQVDPSLLDSLLGFQELKPLDDLEQNLNSVRRLSQERHDLSISTLKLPASISFEKLEFKSFDGSRIFLRMIRPIKISESLSILYWMHGGGYILGSAFQDDAFLANLADYLNCCVISVDYRLAPEFPYPTPLLDCVEGLRYVLSEHKALGLNKDKVILGGVSAGGGLAAGLGLYVRDNKLLSPLGQILIYPMLDDRNNVPNPNSLSEHFVWGRSQNDFAWYAYLGKREHRDSIEVYAAPARSQNLRCSPETFVAIGDLDIFLNENIKYAEQLRDDGVLCEMHIYSGAYHGFIGLAPSAAITLRCLDDIKFFSSRILNA
jgi:acetyl esterase